MNSVLILCWVLTAASVLTVAIWAAVVYFVLRVLWECVRDAWRWWRA